LVKPIKFQRMKKKLLAKKMISLVGLAVVVILIFHSITYAW